MELELTDFGFQVIDPAPKAQVRTFTGDGIIIETPSAERVFAGFRNHPVLAVAPQGQAEFEVDVEAGCSRWHGDKTSREIRAALRGLRFDRSRINEAMAHCRKIGKANCPSFFV